jgi:DNA-directed RNA polymerase specialized sigma24 family protein
MARTPRRPDPGQLERAASRLPALERQVLFLSARGGLRYDDIAARLGISSEAVKDHLADALYHLDRHLERRERPWWKFW